MEFEIYVNDKLVKVKEYPNTMTPFTIIKSIKNGLEKDGVLGSDEKINKYMFNGNKVVIETCQQCL